MNKKSFSLGVSVNALARLLTLSLAFAMVTLFSGCAGSRGADAIEDVKDVLVNIKMYAQAGNYDAAGDLISDQELPQMLGTDNDMKPEFKTALLRLPMSNIGKSGFELDSDGKIVGLYDVLVSANRKFEVSDDQRELTLEAIEARHKKVEPAPAPVVALKDSSTESSEVEQSGEALVEEKSSLSPEEIAQKAASTQVSEFPESPKSSEEKVAELVPESDSAAEEGTDPVDDSGF
jgi:hypothetical protein